MDQHTATTLAGLYDPDIDFDLHAIEAEHLAHQSRTLDSRIVSATRDRLYGPIRDTALDLEYFGTNYRNTEAILRRHLNNAIDEITRSAD